MIDRYTPVAEPISVRVVRHSGDDKTVADSARVSFASLEEMHSRVEDLDRTCSDDDKTLIHYLASRRHMSPFENCHVTFWVEAPIYTARQHMRHRTWSYNEVSRRYTSDGLRIYEPKRYRGEVKGEGDPIIYITQGMTQAYATRATDIVRRTNRQLVDTYHAMLDAGLCMEQARGVLPQSLMTQYYATANLRNLVSFIKERSDTAAQSEIRCMAERMKGAVIKLFPISSEALLEEHCGGSRQYDVGYPLKEEDEHVRHNPNIHVELGKAI